MGEFIQETKEICPDCGGYMDFLIPDDSENYYKCPKCKLEISEDDFNNDKIEDEANNYD